MEQRICKECGKIFIPKGREKYCSDKHYRPCPCCGEPTEVLYFSDPPRKCDKCRGRKSQSPAPKQKNSFIKINFQDAAKEIPKVKEEEQPKETSKALIIDASSIVEQKVLEQSVFCETADNTVRRYVGKEIKGSFIPGHDYLLKVLHNEYTYVITGVEDLTDDITVDIVRNFASQVSINQNFVVLKEGAA